MSGDRLPPMPPSQWSDEQKRVASEIIQGPRGALVSPFVPLLRSPELMQHVQRLGEYLRYRSAIGERLTELAILITARQWSQHVEWAIHAPLAEKAGLSPETVRAIGEGRRSDGMPDDEVVVHDLCMELHHTQGVSDATWAAALARFGERGVVDTVAINGYYTLLAVVMNAARTAVPPSSGPELPPHGM